MTPLRAALLGLDGVGLVYLDALRSCTLFDLVAIADTSAERIRKIEHPPGVTTFDDCRSLVAAQTRDPIDALVVALPPHQSIELLPLAAERGVPVFHHTPFARTTAECQMVAQLFSTARGTFEAARLWSALLPDVTRPDLLRRAGRVVAAHACVQHTQTVTNWRGDPQRAGGGALLYAGYGAVDALVALLGLPESVCAECAWAAAPGAPRGYDTEDVAIVTLRFGHGEIGSLTVWRGADTNQWALTLIGTDATVSVGRPSAREDAGADELAARELEIASSVQAGLEAMGRRLQDRTATRAASSAEAHVATLATIEAAYLSSKTGSAEVPAQFIQEPPG